MTTLQHCTYGGHPEQIADLVLPDGEGPHPVAALVHGGFWRTSYDKSIMGPLAAGLAARGWASWNVEYRRGAASGGPGGAAFGDVRSAVAALRGLGAPLDLDRLVVIGHSAGGHLALSTAAYAQARLTVSLAGVCDLLVAAYDGLGGGAAIEFVGVPPAQDAAAYAAANPILALPTGARVLLVHGDADDRVPISQSRNYLAAARAAGDDCEMLELPGEGHFGVIDPASPAFEAYFARLPG